MTAGPPDRAASPITERRLSLWDRLVFGCLSAAVGALLGGAVALVLMFVLEPGAFNSLLVLFSAGFFLAVGVARGAFAGEFVGEALAYAFSFVAAGGHVAVDPRTQAKTGSPFSSVWLLVVYAAGVVAVGWVG